MDTALAADMALVATWEAANRLPHARGIRDNNGQPTELLKLAARAETSDVSTATLDLLEFSVDEMARSYTRLPPAELLRSVSTCARQISSLLDGWATLAQRRRLLIAAGWTALLVATLHPGR